MTVSNKVCWPFLAFVVFLGLCQLPRGFAFSPCILHGRSNRIVHSLNDVRNQGAAFVDHVPSCRSGVSTMEKAQRSTLFGQKKQLGGSNDLSRMATWTYHLARLKQRLDCVFKWAKRRAAIGLFCFMVIWSLFSSAAVAVSGGRSGGSFKSSPSRPHSSRVYSPPSRSYHRPSSPRVLIRPPSPIIYSNPVPPITIIGSNAQPYGPSYRRAVSAADVAIVAGVGLAVAYGVSAQLQKNREENSSALGPGYSVAKLTVSLNVPDRDAPNSILRTLQQLSSTARTNSREGVQHLISSVALELLRQERSIRSAESKSQHYNQEGDAEREFLRQSILQRSKFDQETEYKEGNLTPAKNQTKGDSKATEAVVTILMSIEGDSTQLPPIKSRNSVVESLNRFAVDAQVEDCLLAGEIYWAPELRSETLSVEEVYADYPNLFPV